MFGRWIGVILALIALQGVLGDDIEHPVRYWVDTGTFAHGETDLLREALERSEGSAVLAGESPGGFLAPKGYYDVSRFDVYWTGHEVRASCMRDV